MTFKLDPNLRPYATERQWELLTAIETHGSPNKAALALGLTYPTVRSAVQRVMKKAALRGYAPTFDLTHPTAPGLRLKGTSIRYNAAGEIEQFWNKTTPEGRAPSSVVHIPDPKTITKTATLYDQEGRVINQWVSEKPEEKEREVLWKLFAEELASGLPRWEPIACPFGNLSDHMACYPIGDHHLGMLAWDKECGDDYDIKIGERLLASAMDYLVETMPPCRRAAVIFLGDFLHYDGFESITPTNRNLLDSDSRYPKMVRVAVRTMRYTIEAALRRHAEVLVIIELGNHDPASSVFLRECMRNIYENEPRITVDTSPSNFHYFDFGSTLVGVHHGHGAKLPELPLIMATDRPDEWGRTTHRYIWTGHVHHDQAKDYAGVRVESFRILPPADAWAAQKGYRAARDMKSILLHPKFGEVARHTASVDMFKEQK